MKSNRMSLGLCVLLLALAALSPAQFSGKRGGGQGGMVDGAAMLAKMDGPMLGVQPLAALQKPDIQTELALTPDQVKQVQGITSKLTSDLRAKAQGARRNMLSAFNVSGIKREARNMLKKANEDAVKILNENQRKRLVEISVQLAGNLSTSNIVVRPLMDLSKDQARKVDSEVEDLQQDVLQLKKNSAASSEVERRVAESQQKIGSILTTEQRARLESLKGAPFHRSAGGGTASR